MNVITNETAARIKKAFGNMPYGGMCFFAAVEAGISEAEAVELLLANVEKLQAQLVKVSTVHNANEQKINEHNEMFAGLGKLIREVLPYAERRKND